MFTITWKRQNQVVKEITARIRPLVLQDILGEMKQAMGIKYTSMDHGPGVFPEATIQVHDTNEETMQKIKTFINRIRAANARSRFVLPFACEFFQRRVLIHSNRETDSACKGFV